LLRERDIGDPGAKGHDAMNDTLRHLVGAGIDDLAKYRIVQYLQECARPLDVSSISASLGLHPRELVAEALESLTSCGVVTREQEPPVYTLSCRPPLQTVLGKFFSPISPQERECILRALASASLAKARARARSNGGEKGG